MNSIIPSNNSYSIHAETIPCPEHNGEHQITRTIAESETMFASVTTCNGRHEAVACDNMDEPVRHIETFSSNDAEEVYGWFFRIFCR